jgi:putative transposase
MKPIAEALEISRSHLTTSLSDNAITSKKNPVKRSLLISDRKLTKELKSIIEDRPSYGYRRACAVINRKFRAEKLPRINHKRVYRVMKESNL